ncbi:hypothetical protein D9M69_451890 [compost metagenome]
MPEISTAPRERPILFSGPMVRAILGGRKTVTRRVIKPVFPASITEVLLYVNAPGAWMPPKPHNPDEPWDEQMRICPYGQPGDRLWVRETWMDLRGTGVEHRPTPDSPLQRYAYGADSPPGSASDEARKDFGLKWRPSIHMPREACRIRLEITDVRAERLHDITVEQIIAEGLSTNLREYDAECDLRRQWRELWESAGGDWESNPWVWAISFKRVTP